MWWAFCIYMNQSKIFKIAGNVGYAIATLFIVMVILYFVLQPRSAASCTAQFINQEMTASDVKENCPNLNKQELIEALINADGLTKETRDILLVDITSNY